MYEETVLTPLRVAQMIGYRDWSSQPCMFKHYPEFLFRYNYEENELFRLVELCRIITSETTIGAKPYLQLNTPSAGNLHPIELYVQIRGIKGILSGIYHVDAGAKQIVLIREIESAGVEAYVGLKEQLSGIVFLVSSVAFRAEWKYAERAIRYCYLDAGHQIGAIGASLKLYNKEMTILSDFDKNALNVFMGFKEDESIVAVLSSGVATQKGSKEFKENLMYVAPTDYSELSSSIIKNISKDDVLKSEVPNLECDINERHILHRRSTRLFDSVGLQKAKFEHYMSLVNLSYPLSFYNIILSDTHKKAGIYLEGELLKEGDFKERVSTLLVDQSFIKNADVVTVICSKYFSANKLMQAGAFAHNLYMQAQVHGFGLSGVGAYYDKKLQNFLGTDEYILYVCVAGEEKK